MLKPGDFVLIVVVGIILAALGFLVLIPAFEKEDAQEDFRVVCEDYLGGTATFNDRTSVCVKDGKIIEIDLSNFKER